jgi:hypothetical protein
LAGCRDAERIVKQRSGQTDEAGIVAAVDAPEKVGLDKFSTNCAVPTTEPWLLKVRSYTVDACADAALAAMIEAANSNLMSRIRMVTLPLLVKKVNYTT